MVKHHVSYTKKKTVEITKGEHYERHFGYGLCFMCYDRGNPPPKKMVKRYFAIVDPRTGKGFTDVEPNGNHPWPKIGKWVLICDECKPKAIGLQITKYEPKNYEQIKENFKSLENKIEPTLVKKPLPQDYQDVLFESRKLLSPDNSKCIRCNKVFEIGHYEIDSNHCSAVTKYGIGNRMCQNCFDELSDQIVEWRYSKGEIVH